MRCAVGEVSYPTFISRGQLAFPSAPFASPTAPSPPSRDSAATAVRAWERSPLNKSRGRSWITSRFHLPGPRRGDRAPQTRKIPILEGPYKLVDTRAVLIEDLDGLALELIEARK